MDVPTYPWVWLYLGLGLIAIILAALVARICSRRSAAKRKGLVENGEDESTRPSQQDARPCHVTTVLNWPKHHQESPPPYTPLPSNRTESEPSTDSKH